MIIKYFVFTLNVVKWGRTTGHLTEELFLIFLKLCFSPSLIFKKHTQVADNSYRAACVVVFTFSAVNKCICEGWSCMHKYVLCLHYIKSQHNTKYIHSFMCACSPPRGDWKYKYKLLFWCDHTNMAACVFFFFFSLTF